MALEACSGTTVCTVVGFPHGGQLTEAKALEARLALDSGAREIDMVVNAGKVLSCDWDFVRREYFGGAGSRTAGTEGVLEVIFENGDLCRMMCTRSGSASSAGELAVDFVKTSTGFAFVKGKNGGSRASRGDRSRSDSDAQALSGIRRGRRLPGGCVISRGPDGFSNSAAPALARAAHLPSLGNFRPVDRGPFSGQNTPRRKKTAESEIPMMPTSFADMILPDFFGRSGIPEIADRRPGGHDERLWPDDASPGEDEVAGGDDVDQGGENRFDGIHLVDVVQAHESHRGQHRDGCRCPRRNTRRRLPRRIGGQPRRMFP